MNKTVNLTLRNETPNALRYEEVGWRDNPSYLIGTLYIRKAPMTKPYPQSITVTVTIGKETA